MAEKEEVIFQFKVEQGDAISDMEKTRRAIDDLKKEQKALNDAYKKGTITQKEWSAEIVRVDSTLKRHQSNYGNLQKSVTGVKTQLDKLIDSNKKISKSFEDAAGQINVAGVNIGQLGTKISSLANPVTGAIGLAGLLGTAYAKSTIGAKDLEFAHDQLAAATTLVSNSFASMISSAKDGEGVVSRFADAVLSFFSPSLAATAKFSAGLKATLDDLKRDEIEIRGQVSDRLTENQEKLTLIADEQTDINDKLEYGNQIVNNLKQNQTELKKVLEDQKNNIIAQLALDSENDDLLTLKLQKEREINKLIADTEKKIQGQVRANQNLIEIEAKRIQQITGNLGLVRTGKEGKLANDTLGDVAAQTGFKKKKDSDIKDGTLATIDSQKVAADALKTITDGVVRNNQAQADSYAKKAQVAKTASELEVKSQEAIQVAIQQAASIFGENTVAYKLLASADAIMNTYKGANIALGTYPPPFSYIAAAATVAAGFANVAQINSVDLGGAAAGGGDFLTKGPTMLMVGDNPGGVERVSVEPISGKGQTKIWGPNMMQMGGGGSITSGDGGLYVNTNTMETNQNLMMKNSLKEAAGAMQIFASWKEYSNIDSRMRAKENRIKIGKRSTR